jgi:leucyl/phenylalanyl-tRNA---protein transferase
MALEIVFPDPDQADDDGLIAIGGSLSVEFLTAAYTQGLFPWFNEGEPILWWSPNPRMVLFPEEFICSKSLFQKIRSHRFVVKIDENFDEVIRNCAEIGRTGQEGTWISKEIMEAYIKLHALGIAHSVETYHDGVLVGGLYGVSFGRAFFGESMFHRVTDASKVALYYLSKLMVQWEFHFIDVQQSTNHLRSLGAKDMPREVFLKMLKESLAYPTKQEKWEIEFQ